MLNPIKSNSKYIFCQIILKQCLCPIAFAMLTVAQVLLWITTMSVNKNPRFSISCKQPACTKCTGLPSPAGCLRWIADFYLHSMLWFRGVTSAWQWKLIIQGYDNCTRLLNHNIKLTLKLEETDLVGWKSPKVDQGSPANLL